MATGNGHTTATITELREQADLLRAQSEHHRARLEAVQLGLLESLSVPMGGGWGSWVHPASQFLDPDGQRWYPAGGGIATGRPDDHKDGANRPFVWSDVNLDWMRAAARWLAATNPLAIGALEAVQDYTIRTGFEWELKPARGYEKNGIVARLVSLGNRVLDEFRAVNEWECREREACYRASRDGECFLRAFRQDDGGTLVRDIYPEQVRQPLGSAPRYSFGILHDEEDIEARIEYAVVYGDPDDWEEVPAEQVAHLTLNVDRCVKRGLSDLFSTAEAFQDVDKFLRALRVCGYIQACMPYAEQFDHANAAALSALAAARRDLSNPASDWQHPFSGRNQNYEQAIPGKVPLISGGRSYVPQPSAANAPNHISVIQAELRALGARWKMPEWMISGDASNNNFASSLVAGAPFVVRTECRQKTVWLPYFRRVLLSVLRNAADAGRFRLGGRVYSWRELAHYVDLLGTPPQVATPDPQKEAQVDQQDMSAGVMSKQTRRERRGLNHEQEEERIAAEKEACPECKDEGGDDEGQGGAPPDDGPDDDGGGDEFGLDELLAELAEARVRMGFAQRLLEGVIPNKVGTGCHDDETGHPAHCPGGEPDEQPGPDKGEDRLSAAQKREAAMVAAYAVKHGYDPAALSDEQAAHLAKVIGREEFSHYSPDKLKEIAARHQPEKPANVVDSVRQAVEKAGLSFRTRKDPNTGKVIAMVGSHPTTMKDHFVFSVITGFNREAHPALKKAVVAAISDTLAANLLKRLDNPDAINRDEETIAMLRAKLGVVEGRYDTAGNLLEAVVPNKTGPRCHDDKTGRPAPCGHQEIGKDKAQKAKQVAKAGKQLARADAKLDQAAALLAEKKAAAKELARAAKKDPKLARKAAVAARQIETAQARIDVAKAALAQARASHKAAAKEHGAAAKQHAKALEKHAKQQQKLYGDKPAPKPRAKKEAPKPAPAPKRATKDDVKAHVEAALVGMDNEQGHRVSIPDLVKQTGASTADVHAALKELYAEGKATFDAAVVPAEEFSPDEQKLLMPGIGQMHGYVRPQDPTRDDARFTGTDALGRRWQDGKLMAKQDEPALAAQPAAGKPAAADVEHAIADAVERIGEQNAVSGIPVKLWDVVDAVVQAHPSLSRQEVHDHLTRLQAEDRLELQKVNMTHLEPRAGEGIQRGAATLGYVQPGRRPLRPAGPAPAPAAQPAATPAQAEDPRPEPGRPKSYRLSGGTFAHREAIKAAGGVYDPDTKTWTVPANTQGKLPSSIRHLRGFDWAVHERHEAPPPSPAPAPAAQPAATPAQPKATKPAPAAKPAADLAAAARDLYDRVASPEVTQQHIDDFAAQLATGSKADALRAAEALGMAGKSKDDLVKAVRDRMVERKGGTQRSGLGTPGSKKQDWSQTAENQKRAAEAHPESVIKAFRSLDQGYNHVSIADLKDALGVPDLPTLHAALKDLMRAGVLVGSPFEGRHGEDKRLQGAAIIEPSSRGETTQLSHVELQPGWEKALAAYLAKRGGG